MYLLIEITELDIDQEEEKLEMSKYTSVFS